MFDLDRWEEIWVTITRNKVRSLLTAFGVFWGILMLVVMLGAGTGLVNGMTKGIDGFATNSCFMGTASTGEPYKGFQKGRVWNFHNRDLDILLDRVPEIETLSPMLFAGRSTNNVIYNEYSGTFNVKGLHPNYEQIEQQRIRYGRYINEIDIERSRKVCVIGEKVYEELFPTNANPLGVYIRVNNIYYQVVGVSTGVSDVSLGGRSEESVVVPFTTLQQINNQGDVIHILAATAKPRRSVEQMEKKMTSVLRLTNHISPTDTQAVWSLNIGKEFKMFNYLFIGVAILIWVVGSGTLMAGIIGVSNIMLVTVKERTKEIGIRRALGAKPRTIIAQVMSESLVLTAAAGLLGICAGVLILYLADTLWLQNAENMYLSDPMVSFGTALYSTAILLFCGLLAGAIPAWRALKIKAIDAIREE